RIEAGQIAQNLRKSPDHVSTILIALTSDEPGEELYGLGFNDAFKKPFDGGIGNLNRRLLQTESAWMQEELSKYQSPAPCEICHGARLH
ncbi:hypothetical protein B4Q13_24100, partial [Lacticaseibacillus rhamnosus]